MKVNNPVDKLLYEQKLKEYQEFKEKYNPQSVWNINNLDLGFKNQQLRRELMFLKRKLNDNI